MSSFTSGHKVSIKISSEYESWYSKKLLILFSPAVLSKASGKGTSGY